MKYHFQYKETIVNIVCDEPYLNVAEDAIFEARKIIEDKVAEDEFFKITYEPYRASPKDHELIQRMCNASLLSDVGPFAGVAGAVATYSVEKMHSKNANLAIVENGGDIAFLSHEPKIIGLFADHPVLKDIAFKIQSDRITGICSSSAKIGPSVSLGKSNVCTVFSDDVILADCCATALGNLIRDGGQEEMSSALETIGSKDGVSGCVSISNGLMAMFGSVPELIRADHGEVTASSIIF